MMTLPRRTVAAIAVMLAAVPVAAQDTVSASRPVAAGDTVRLHENRITMVHGILLRRDSTGLVVVDRATRDTVHIPLFQITRAEVQRGSHRRGASAAANGAAVGALIGGLLIGAYVLTPDKHDEGVGAVVTGLAAVVIAGVGTAVGVIASVSRTETWVTFDPAALPLQASGSSRPTPGVYAISTST